MITIIGQFFGTSGYANHTRYLANAINKQVDVCMMTQLMQGWEMQVNDKELEMFKRQTDYKTNLIITHPVNWRVNCNAQKNIVYLVWEGDSVPRYFIDECMNRKIDKIIVPSEHTYDAVVNTITDDYEKSTILEKLVIIPHGVDLDIFKPLDTPKRDTFRFMANKGLTNLEDRGGLQYLIRAYLEEFSADENVELLLKINSAYGVPNLLEMFPELAGKTPLIHINANPISNADLNKLYNDCDVFVSPTRGEAFNIPCLEAMACGKPVITTSFGGQTDFMKHGHNGYTISGELTEVQHDLQYEGIKWLTPDMETLKILLRKTYREIKDSKLKEDCIETAKNFTWDKTASKIISLT